MDISEDMSLCPFPKRDPELGDNGIHGEADYPQTKRLRLDEHLVNTSSSNSGTATPCGSSGMEYHHHALQQVHCRGQLPLPYTQATQRRQPPPSPAIALSFLCFLHPFLSPTISHDARTEFPGPQVLQHNLLPSHPLQVSALQESDLNVQNLQRIQEYETDRIVCFGMLRNIQIRINHVQDPQSLCFDEILGDTGDFASLDLFIQDDRCDIVSKQGIYIATLNTRTQHALSSIRLPEAPTWLGVIPKFELQQRIKSVAESSATAQWSSKVTCTMSVLVIGSPSIAQALARELAQHHLFLQHPEPKPDLEYSNPQYLSWAGAPCLDRPILPPILGIAKQNDTDGLDVLGREGQGHDNCDYDDDDARAILDDFPQQALRNEIDVDNRIRTKLEGHQREAVDFILSRESAYSRTKNTLWRLESWDWKEHVYKHIITGTRSREPVDIRGGILADDMGVGKTLSMIASIVTSPPSDITTLEKPADSNFIFAKSTLVVVPSVLLLHGWIDEVKKHLIPGALKFYKYHGPGRCISLSSPPSDDIILTTYATVEADFSSSGGKSVLNRIHWHRLILDEAHVIRNASTKQFKAIQRISASIRWCMTGTPIQNSLKDLASLVQFLRIPYLDSVVGFRKYMTKASSRSARSVQPNYANLKCLLSVICLRRKMSTVFPALGGTFITYRPSFSEAERRVYDELIKAYDRRLKAATNMPTSKGRADKLILTAKLRLRMFCNTGLRSVFLGGRADYGSDAQKLSSDEIVTLLQQSGQNTCSICNMEILTLDPDDDDEGKSTTPSLDTWLSSSHHRVLECQTCACLKASLREDEQSSNDLQSSTAITTTTITTSDDKMIDSEETISTEQDLLYPIDPPQASDVYPSKLMTLLTDIREHYLEDKSIVFSFWRQSLDVLSGMFDQNGIVFCRVDGIMSPMKRRTMLEEFQNNPAVRVLLMTIGTGAVGLNNLSVASRVHILEPQWNPSVESQAIGRALRWGQGKKIFVIRYVMEGTVEKIIESGQLRKLQLSLDGREIR
ncbi:DEAD/DEAH box helicase [Aspergillus vadensis CBS 113365]|uniref:SNF2 family helicase n=1 Tax=Aspergillus vadensis (strain CBS 113365 / IMI 142717 / IBT 24658) TaxID=1448311 RepID=A0A319B9N5_ASPVC|nr:hypothetical protein BO88DRAFT_425302 [Aspergillus vadensis CBS 113365]PYH69626.1 hypothetical protein BO88DRAFT_425302 [Aspergillus vadensis CBS 113365]